MSNRLFLGTAVTQQTGFPEFKDADVHIVISGSRQYQLHSSILKNGSPTMRALLDDTKVAKLSSKAIKDGIHIRFRLQLVPDEKEEGKYVLDKVELNDRGRAVNAPQIPLDLENGKTVDPVFLAYHAVLGAFYQVQLDLGDASGDSLSDILSTAMNILEVAEYLDCINVITHPIEATLLATGQLLHTSITNLPAAWLSYAYRLRSRVLFREALIHGAGQYHMPSVQSYLSDLEFPVQQILKKKADTLKEAMKQAVRRILTYYPTHIQREKTVGRADKDSIGRASYANDIMTWIALVVLRHYFAQNVAEDQTHHAVDMGKEMVDLIMQGGEAYLAKQDLEDFHKFFPMSGKAGNVLESKLADMKEYVKRFVVDLTRNESHLEPSRTVVKHFLCTKVELENYPWGDKAMQRRDTRFDEDEDEEDEDVGDAEADGEDMSE